MIKDSPDNNKCRTGKPDVGAHFSLGLGKFWNNIGIKMDVHPEVD